MMALRRPLGGLTHLRQFDPHVSDLVGVIVGAKPILYMDFLESDWPYIRGLCRAFGLKHFLPESGKGRSWFHQDGAKRMLLLGKDPGVFTKAVESWTRPTGNVDWGVLLGYPDCCVRAYGAWQRDRDDDIIRRIHENTKAGPLSFLLNNIANYYSRHDPIEPAADQKRYAAMMRLGAAVGADIAALNVVSWHSCSYRCRESLKKARLVYAFMEENLPQWALRLRKHLSNPIIYIDKYEFVSLRGTIVAPGVIESVGVCPPYSLMAADLVRSFDRARRIKVDREGVSVEPGGARMVGRASRPILLDFRADPR